MALRNLQLINYKPADHPDRERGLHVSGDFALVEPPAWGDKMLIGNYLEVVLHKKLGVINHIQRPDGTMQPVRGYELVIHHSAIHGDGPYEKVKPPELVRYTATGGSDAILQDQAEGAQITIRPVMVKKRLGPDQTLYRWYTLAVDGVFMNPTTGEIGFVPHNCWLEH